MINLANIRRIIRNICVRLDILEASAGISGGGSNGKSAYELAVDNGYTGTLQEWLNSLNGTNGTTPHIDLTTGNWFIGETNTGVSAQGPAGPQGPSVLSNWDESDTSDLSYIKNRPFYSSTGYSTISNGTITCTQIGPTHGGGSIGVSESLIAGQIYKVTIDDDEYIVEAANSTYGDASLNLDEGWDNPFNDTWSVYPYSVGPSILYNIAINGAIGQTKTIKIEKQVPVVGKLLDSEYVDLSSYYTKTESDNRYLRSQTLSDWEESVSTAADFIKNKPFGVETYVKSEKVLEGTFNREYSGSQANWVGSIPTNILSVGDTIRLVINGEDRGDYTTIFSASNTWTARYYDAADGFRIWPASTNGQVIFYGADAGPATNLPSGTTISVEIWKCVPGETKLDNKYVDYENSVYINNIKNSIPKIWRGTQAQYNLLTPNNNTIYIITA